MAKTVPNRASTLDRGGLDDTKLIAMLRNMLLQRQVDNRGIQLNRQGKIPFAAGSEGHEAIQAGAAMAFERGRDILAPYYRDLGLALGTGYSALDALTSLFARATSSGGRQFPSHFTNRAHDTMSISSIIAGHCSHAVGAAFTLTYRGEAGRVVLCSTGEGATSEGEWHESVNFAAIHKLPIVFLVQNNSYAISTPQSLQMAVADVAEKAAGYGIPGMICDGIDPIASYRAMKVAMDRARAGNGPTLVEAKCYRYLSHTTDDDDRTYRDRGEIAEQRKNDPVPKYERTLLEAGIIDADRLAELKADVLRETNEAMDAAEAQPGPAASDLYLNVYAGPYEPWQ